METEGAVSPKAMPRTPPLVHPPVKLLFVWREFHRCEVSVLPESERDEDVNRLPVPRGAQVVQLLADQDLSFPGGDALGLLDHEPFGRQAPIFKADPGEGVRVEEDANMKDDSNQGQRNKVKAKRKKTRARAVVSGANNIATYFNSPPAKKNTDELSETRSKRGTNSDSCAKCEEEKSTNCGICFIALCDGHAQLHFHPQEGDEEALREISERKKLRRVTFADLGPSKVAFGPLLEDGEVSGTDLDEEEGEQVQIMVEDDNPGDTNNPELTIK